MRLMLCNGSPRGKGSNTTILLKHFIDGFTAAKGNSVEYAYLNNVKSHAAAAAQCSEADAVIIAFPLYADSMPAIVKDFIETLGAGRKKRKKQGNRGSVAPEKNPPMGFIVQSGFPEAIHSRYVEKYLEKLALRMGSRYIGTVIRGGVEGIQVKPEYLNRRLFMAFASLGRHFGVTKEFHPITAKKLAGRDRMTAFGRVALRLFMATGLNNIYWNMQMKKNGAFERSFDRPYQP
jgi:FMN-dependent NADH-azoreductase